MISRSIHDYFFFGTCVRYLQDASIGGPIGDLPDRGWGIRTNLRKAFDYLEVLGLRVTLRHASCARLRKVLSQLDKQPDDSVLTADQATRLRAAMTEIRDTLDAELCGLFAYSVTPKKLDVERLTTDVGSLFSPGVFAKLPEVARHDLTEAGRCIAYELSTAAAFHVLRATEAVLRAFYKVLVKRGRKATMWGPIVADLRLRRVARNEEVLLNHLDNIRMSFRNPTQHPEKIYDIQEVSASVIYVPNTAE